MVHDEQEKLNIKVYVFSAKVELRPNNSELTYCVTNYIS